jgi:EAL domain-containing protein (putative c-di-GMP-specific phosphodiesterase class I)
MGDREVFVRASIGIATHSEVSGTGEELLGNADVAMYTAKARGKGRFEHFEHRMHAALVERLDIEQNLRDAIEKEQFVLHYQPVVSLQSGAVPAVEALVRWRHPERGEIAPGHFIELAEETGLIVPIGRWVLNAACRQAAEWKRQLGREKPLTMMVNLSAKQLEDPEFVGHVRAALDGAGLDPGELLLEITERLVVDDEDTIATMKSIRGLGVRIGIDDFGTKYSSLSYLRRFPIDVLKIDQEFMRGVTHGSPEAALVRAIIAMSDSMRLTAIAEGVENAEQEEELRRMGCGLAQGFLFARPAPAHEIAELIVDSGASSLIEKATTSGW